MRAVRLTDSGLLFDAEYPSPSVGPTEALIRVQLAGICSTDLELVKGYYNFRGVLGHEFVGVVEHCADSYWQGRRVVSSINFADPNSSNFAEYGLEHDPQRTVLGILGRDGAMADYVAVPVANLYEVPASVDDQRAVFAEPLAAALRIAEQMVLRPSQAVAVIGPGRLGMLVSQVLAARGTQVKLLGRNPASLQLAQRMHFETNLVEDVPDSSFACVVDCSGAATGFQQAVRITRPRGTLVLKSTYQGAAPLELTKLVVDEIQVLGSRCGPFAPALRMLARDEVEVAALVDGRYSIENAAQAFAHAAQPSVRKILLELA